MFMRENRKKNGAPQPEAVASKEAGSQRSARQLSPNDFNGLEGEDRRFAAQLSSCAAINDAHYESGISGDGPYKDTYGQHIPFVGVKPPTNNTLKG